MALGLAFWIIMLIWFVLWLAGRFGAAPYPWMPILDGALLFVLFLLLGWKVFGAPLHG